MVPREEMERDPRILTNKIKQAKSVDKLLKVLDHAVDRDIFNEIHASAAHHGLATRDKLSQKQAESPVLSRLHDKLRALIAADQVNSWACASIFWSAEKLFPTLPGLADVIPDLVQAVKQKCESMTPQALSNCIWTVAKLRKDVLEVLQLVPCLVKQVPSKARKMKPQELSNSLWAAAKLCDTTPGVVKMVPSIVKEIMRNADDMTPQAHSNCLWAAVQLKDAVPNVTQLIPVTAPLIAKQTARMKLQELANSLEAMTLLGDVDLHLKECFGSGQPSQHLASKPARKGPYFGHSTHPMGSGQEERAGRQIAGLSGRTVQQSTALHPSGLEPVCNGLGLRSDGYIRALLGFPSPSSRGDPKQRSPLL